MNIHTPLSYLSQFVEEYPLYSKFGTDQPVTPADLNNLRFNFLCCNENKIQPFQLQAASSNGHATEDISSFKGIIPAEIAAMTEFTEMFHGVCQSCNSYRINIVVNGGMQAERPKYFIRKIGQYPAPQSTDIKLPGEIHYFLNDRDRNLYSRAMRNLESGYGTGALAYFQRVIENEMEKIIEMITGFHELGSQAINDAMATYKIDHQKTKFIAETESLFPANLREHGAQVLLLLQDAASIDMSMMEEEECFKKSKDIDTLFRYLARKITEKKNKLLTAKDIDGLE